MFTRWLNAIEKAGNRLPHPALLFGMLALLILLVSWIGSLFGLSATHPVSGESIATINLLSGDGLRRILGNTVTNFTGFAPVGTVLVAMLGLGIAERSGLIDCLLRRAVQAAPDRLLGFIVAFAGVLSSLAADSGYVVLIPLAAPVFIAAGRHPVVGMVTAFAGVSAGFSANLLIGPLDALLAGLSTASVQLVDADYVVNAAGNWWFILVSSGYIAVVIAVISAKLIEPRFASATVGTAEEDRAAETATGTMPAEADVSRGLKAVTIATVLLVLVLLICLVPANGILRNPDNGSILQSPFITNIVVIIAVWAAMCGILFGRITGSLGDGRAVVGGMESTMATMAGYLVLMFFAAQFVAWFGWTNLGLILAVKGSELLQALDPSPLLLLLIFIVIAAFINLFIGSASAKWAIMGPVFVPMLYLLGISPEGTQMAYRVGDSVTNIITPLNPYFALVIAFIQKYDREAGIGTLMAAMLPFSIALLVSWSLLLALWFLFGLPLGPGSSFLL